MNENYRVFSSLKFFYNDMEEAINGDLNAPIDVNWWFVVFNYQQGSFVEWNENDVLQFNSIVNQLLLWSFDNYY